MRWWSEPQTTTESARTRRTEAIRPVNKSPRPRPPPSPSVRSGKPLGLLELDRFSNESLTSWKAFSKDLDELQAALYFGVQPEQRRLREILIATLHETKRSSLTLDHWVRIVTYQYSMEPLSAAGSLHAFGGRFNAGVDLDASTLNPWPALYVAEDYETAFRERHQMSPAEVVDGLTPHELALVRPSSHSTVYLNGSLANVFDMTTPGALASVARILARIKLPAQARTLMKSLRIPPKLLWMIATGQQLYDAVLTYNWRTLPIQFGLPASGHTLAELVRAAGFEAILYRSTKGKGRCLAIFPDLLGSHSHVELADVAPAGVTRLRLDASSGEYLAGWDTLPSQRRPR